MGLPLIGAAWRLIRGGPLVGELLKLDKEAQRDVANGFKYLCIALSIVLVTIGCIISAVIVRLAF